MSLELVNAIASVVTAVVISATAIAAIIQLRHLRMNNQITALLAVRAELNTKEFREAERLVRKEFPAILEDEGFCAYFIGVLKDQEQPESSRYLAARYAARVVANTYENLGVLVKRGILDKNLLLDVYAFVVSGIWGDLEGFVAIVRAVTGEQAIFANFEYLASISRGQPQAKLSPYPAQAKRLNPRLSKAAAKLLDA